MTLSPPPIASLPRWEFDRKSANTPQIEPIQGEFFAGEALEDPASALVRETIQNSLDARAGEAPVRMRFTLPAEAPARGFESPWLVGLGPHLFAEHNGLKQRPNEKSAVSTLLIEDYGTLGLPGDVRQTNNTSEEYRGQRNHFFHFWRAVGSRARMPLSVAAGDWERRFCRRVHASIRSSA